MSKKESTEMALLQMQQVLDQQKQALGAAKTAASQLQHRLQEAHSSLEKEKKGAMQQSLQQQQQASKLIVSQMRQMLEKSESSDSLDMQMHQMLKQQSMQSAGKMDAGEKMQAALSMAAAAVEMQEIAQRHQQAAMTTMSAAAKLLQS